MTTHELKLNTKWFEAVASGAKKNEIATERIGKAEHKIRTRTTLEAFT